ncbi:SHOCT domain-containing protein [Flavobacterium sp.]|uniref:SHOCT domain-containing protein n=1 Tax=Flavobacterium sp. TaxID=239 RepID=UPI002FDCA48E
MRYEDYYFGMNVIWWIIWLVLLFWIFFVPYDIPGQRRPKDSALDILKKRFANGEITETEYHHQKKILEDDFNKDQNFNSQK